jgi:two-component system, sensor histidine kinase and response regulator
MFQFDAENRQRILIVEDDFIVRRMLADILSLQYEIDDIGDAEKLIPILHQGNYDLLLLDVRLPKVNGFDILREIRADNRLLDLPVVLISGKADASDVIEGLAAGANDFIPKPIETRVLQARIGTHLKLKQLQDERKRYISHLEEAERIRSQFARIASHDIKSPLNNLRMAEQLLREEVPANNRVEQLLNTVSTSLDMMEDVISAFLDMVAIQSQNLNLKKESILLRDVINRVVMQYEIAAEKKGILLKVNSTQGKVIGDSARMIQIAGNLLSNAIKYSPPNSEVHISTEQHGERIRLRVADKGKGVPEAERHLLFKEFSRLSTRPTAGEGSTGLGLWIVKHLMEMQGGDAGADFPKEGGSVFWVEMQGDGK